MTIPDSLRPALEEAERLNTFKGWHNLHVAALFSKYPGTFQSPEWEAHYQACSWLITHAMWMKGVLMGLEVFVPQSTIDVADIGATF